MALPASQAGKDELSPAPSVQVGSTPTSGQHTGPTDEAESSLLAFKGSVCGVPARCLIDSGAKVVVVTSQFARARGLRVVQAPHRAIRLPNGLICPSTQVVPQARIGLPDATSTHATLRVVPGLRLNCDVILGKPWLAAHNPRINYRTNLVQLRTPDGAWAPGFTARTEASGAHGLNLISARAVRKLVRRRKGGKGAEQGDVIGMLQVTAAEVVESPRTNDTTPPLDQLLAEYADVFAKKTPAMPPKRPVDHAIELVADSATRSWIDPAEQVTMGCAGAVRA